MKGAHFGMLGLDVDGKFLARGAFRWWWADGGATNNFAKRVAEFVARGVVVDGTCGAGSRLMGVVMMRTHVAGEDARILSLQRFVYFRQGPLIRPLDVTTLSPEGLRPAMSDVCWKCHTPEANVLGDDRDAAVDRGQQVATGLGPGTRWVGCGGRSAIAAHGLGPAAIVHAELGVKEKRSRGT